MKRARTCIGSLIIIIAGIVLFSLLPGTTASGLPMDIFTAQASREFPVQELQALLNKSVYDTDVPGILMAIQTKSTIWISASGISDLETGKPMSPYMKVRIGGITRVFMAALILKLSEERLLSLDDTVEKWLPGMVPGGGKITLMMLLSQTSGLYNYANSLELWQKVYENPGSQWAPEDLMEIIAKAPPISLPGVSWYPSSTDYFILGLIAEKATKKPLEEELRSRFFGPLGMSGTSLPRSGALTPPFVHGYTWNPLQNKMEDTSAWDFSWKWPSGSGVTTAIDMLTWTNAFVEGRVVSLDSMKKMMTILPPSRDYGLGLYVKEKGGWGEKELSQSGGNPGMGCQWTYLPDSGRIVFVAINRLDMDFDKPSGGIAFINALIPGVRDILNEHR
ncbi:MAG: serine hydrolase domain-containing protein [Candidatus Eremiobacteraeota bacterium]|nr:serine hydrolase domain-containing protein [Candidatus Eremiobacteraeota bacterium]